MIIIMQIIYMGRLAVLWKLYTFYFVHDNRQYNFLLLYYYLISTIRWKNSIYIFKSSKQNFEYRLYTILINILNKTVFNILNIKSIMKIIALIPKNSRTDKSLIPMS